MKLPTIQTIIQSAWGTVKRFPLALLLILIGVISLICMVENSNLGGVKEDTFVKIFLCALLGFPLAVSAILYAESKSKHYLACILSQFIALSLTLIFYFLTPELKDFNAHHYSLYFVFLFSNVLFATIAPYLFSQNLTKYWQFNCSMITRLLVTGIYAGVLYAGISIAMLAVHFLFDFRIDEKYYADLFFLAFGLFGGWFFLAGIPQDFRHLDTEKAYPKSLKIFTQYILLPLIILYFIILYAYSARILFLWELPKGWVSYLILALSALGILAFLFVWPTQNSESKSWVKSYSRYFYRLLIPLIVLLFVSIFRRISDYGITYKRYYVLALAIWLTGITTYFIISKKKNIKHIPVSLIVVALLTTFGPWGAFPISKTSQIHRLENLLTENKVLVNGKIDTLHVTLQDSVEVEINQVLKYLSETNNLNDLEKRWGVSMGDTSVSPQLDRYQVADYLKLKSSDLYYNSSGTADKHFYFNEYSTKKLMDISEYDYILSRQIIYYGEGSYNDSLSFQVNEIPYAIRISGDGKKLQIREQGNLFFETTFASIYQLMKSKDQTVDPKDQEKILDLNSPLIPSISAENQQVRIKLLVSEFSGEKDTDLSPKAEQIQFDLLVKKK